LEETGHIQILELTFVLAWETVKNYFDKMGFEAKLPRDVIQVGFQYGTIMNGD
jgi:hypothetical protein